MAVRNETCRPVRLNVTTDSAVSSKSVPHEYFYQTELLDRTLFRTTADLEAKLIDFQHYSNGRPLRANMSETLLDR